MTFADRMAAPTSMPRSSYLLSKPLHTIAIAAIIIGLTGLPALPVAWFAVVLYVGIGLALWYRHGIKQWIGPGSFIGDLLYHTSPSLPAPILYCEWPVWLKLLAFAATCAVWWQLDTAGYGPVRDG